MKRSVSLVAGGVLLAASAGVQAQASDLHLQMDRGFYVSAGIGKSRTGEGCIGVCDVTDRSWNVSAGYQFNRHFGVEVGYVDFGEATVSGTVAGVPATAVVESKAVELLGVALLPLSERFAFYLKGGVFRSDSDSVTSGAVVGTGRENDNGFTFAGGMQYSFTPNIAARLEWQSYSDVGTGVIGLERDDVVVWRVGGRVRF